MIVRRALVALAVLLALAVGVDKVIRASALFVVAGKVLATAFAALVAAGAAERLWRGATVADARRPGGEPGGNGAGSP